MTASPASGGRGKGLTRELLIRMALAIVDEEGLDALSMRRLGARLGVDPMAAYRHIPNKEALLDGVVEAVVTEIDLETDASESWQEQLRRLVAADVQVKRAHPNVLPLLAVRPLSTPASLRLVERALDIMASAGIPLTDAAVAINATGMLSVGLTMAEAATQRHAPSSAETRARFASLPAEQFPRISHAVRTGQVIGSYDQLLDFALDAFIERLERLVDSSAS